MNQANLFDLEPSDVKPKRKSKSTTTSRPKPDFTGVVDTHGVGLIYMDLLERLYDQLNGDPKPDLTLRIVKSIRELLEVMNDTNCLIKRVTSDISDTELRALLSNILGDK